MVGYTGSTGIVKNLNFTLSVNLCVENISRALLPGRIRYQGRHYWHFRIVPIGAWQEDRQLCQVSLSHNLELCPLPAAFRSARSSPFSRAANPGSWARCAAPAPTQRPTPPGFLPSECIGTELEVHGKSMPGTQSSKAPRGGSALRSMVPSGSTKTQVFGASTKQTLSRVEAAHRRAIASIASRVSNKRARHVM